MRGRELRKIGDVLPGSVAGTVSWLSACVNSLSHPALDFSRTVKRSWVVFSENTFLSILLVACAVTRSQQI